MKFQTEFRDATLARGWVEAIHKTVTRPWRIMEVCGGQTHSIVRFGLDQLLPDQLSLVHGPGCPVCVTPLESIDGALAVASLPNVVFCSFGDMLRVPGSSSDLLAAKARGADVRIVYSPLDALEIAAQNPDRQVVFFAIGFETTAPANAMAVLEAERRGVENFSLVVSHVLVPPAMSAILEHPERSVDAFLAAGHVCAVMGTQEYRPLAARYRVPIVVTGFEPIDLLQGIFMCVNQLEAGRAEVENQYARSVRTEGNPPARRAIAEVFEVVRRSWRGIGEIPHSGLGLRPRYQKYDALARFAIAPIVAPEPIECISGLVLLGAKKPAECPAFGTRCTPEHPLGATMVSSEGTCAAYYRYRSGAR